MKKGDKQSDGEGKKPRRKRIVRPKEDTVSFVEPPKGRPQSKKDREVFRVCALPWEALTKRERLRGLTEAEHFGRVFARDWSDKACVKSYYEIAIMHAFQFGVINDIEADIWRLMPEHGDPRVMAFRLGCMRWRLRYPGKGGRLARANLKNKRKS